MESAQTDIRRATPAFQWRALISVIVALSFLLLVVSGIGLWVAPPGRIANWTDWTIFGLRKKEWADLHLWFGLMFVISSGFHVALNWRPLLGYFKGKLSRQFSFRREWLAAGFLCALLFAGTRMEIPPFSLLLAFTENFRESWGTQSESPPIPHAELLTVEELARQADVNLTNALTHLAARGIKDASPKTRVADLAKHSQVPAQQIYKIMTVAPRRRAALRPGQGTRRWRRRWRFRPLDIGCVMSARRHRS